MVFLDDGCPRVRRLATVMRADNIVVLKAGEIVAQGTHQSLMQTCPYYNELVQKQMIAEKVLQSGDEEAVALA